MNTQDIRRLAMERLISVDPQLAIDKSLSLLLDKAEASEAALFVARRDGPKLVGGHGIDQVSVDRVRAAWADDELGLQAGRRTVRDRWCVWPLAAANRTTGLIYIAANSHSLDMERVREAIVGLGDFLVAAVELDGSSTAAAIIDLFLKVTPKREIERRRLLAVLAANEWNIARVSRIIGCSRRTVYNHLERLGIERKRVEKELT